MAISRTFILLGLAFAFVLLIASEVSARELVQENALDEDHYNGGYGHGGYGKGHGGYGKGHGGYGHGGYGKGKGGYGHGGYGHGGYGKGRGGHGGHPGYGGHPDDAAETEAGN